MTVTPQPAKTSVILSGASRRSRRITSGDRKRLFPSSFDKLRMTPEKAVSILPGS
jgi:hypothetical protein